MVKQQLREWRGLRPALIIHPEIWLGYYRAEQRGMATKSVLINGRLFVHISAMID